MPRPTRRFRVVASGWLLASLAFVVPSHAQSADATVAATPQLQADLPVRFDMAFSVSTFDLNATGLRYAPGHGAIVTKGSSFDQDVYGPDPPVTVAALVSAGYYWNAHTKTEVEVGWRDRSDVYDTDPPCPLIGSTIRCDLRPPGPVAFLMHNYQMRRVALAQLFRFRKDARFQPYIGAGISFQFEREDDSRSESAFTRMPPGVSAPSPGPGAFRTSIRPFARAGFQEYTSDRVFVVTELRYGNPEGWTVKLGLGAGF